MSDLIQLTRVPVGGDLRREVDTAASRTGGGAFAVLFAAYLAVTYRHTRREEIAVRIGDVTVPCDVPSGGNFADLVGEASRGLARKPAAGGGDTVDAAAIVAALGAETAVDTGTFADAEAAGHHFAAIETRDGWDVEFGPHGDAAAYLALLADAVRRPHAAIAGLAMLSEDEAAATAERINVAHEVYPGLRPVHDAFEAVAACEPGLIAVRQGPVEVTYGELDRRANLLARRLGELGVGPESRVAVLTERSPDLLVALLGIWKAGAAFVPLDPRMPVQRISVIARDAGIAAFVTQERFLERLADAPAPAVVVQRDGADRAPGVRVSLANTAYVYYTSGSTGTPKGVVIDHRCAAGRLEWLARRYGLRPGDRVVHKTPLIFDVAIWEIAGPLSAGATVALADPGAEADVAHLGALLSADATVFAHFVPSMLSAYLNLAPARRYPDLRWVQLSGEAVPTRLLEQFTEHFGAEFHNLYGQTETSEVAAWEGRSHTGGPRVPIGRQIGVYRLFVLDEDLNPVPPGVPGELCVSGLGGLARGYHGRPGLTADRFVPHPYPIAPGERLYRTGDLAVADADGVLTHLGRLDDQTKIRGCRVEVGEVEAVLSRHEAVQDCAVVARPDEEGDNQLVAYLVGDGASAAELAAHAEHHLPDYMLPAVYVALESLPLGPSGKLDRGRLPAPSAENRAALEPADEPLGPVEQVLAELWKEILEADGVGVSAGFFSVGGNSLKALQMLNRVTEMFGVDYAVSDFFAGPTIAEMAAAIERSLAERVAGLSDDEAAEMLSALEKAGS
ncbi:non-ribosomal peptide synthetase [Spirillospora sp. CA-255316]